MCRKSRASPPPPPQPLHCQAAWGWGPKDGPENPQCAPRPFATDKRSLLCLADAFAGGSVCRRCAARSRSFEGPQICWVLAYFSTEDRCVGLITEWSAP